ncbi:hypothetical protein [Enterobacter cancerogenus]
MALIDEFLYALGFQADLRGGQAFDEQLQRIGDHGESTRGSLLKTITAANLLSSALEKGAELAKDVGAEFLHTAKEMEDAKITFESMYASAAEGEEKFRWLLQFSRENPVMGFEAAKETFMALKNNGIEPTAAALKALGDSMAALPEVGKYLPQGLSELIEGRYSAGGVLSPLVNLHGAGKNKVYEGSYVNRQGAKVDVKLDFNDAQKATDQFMQILRDRFDGTMAAHGKTMTGLISRWRSDWLMFQKDFMDNHLFASLEEELSSLLDEWERFSQSRDAKMLLSTVSLMLSKIVQTLGEAIRITGSVVEWFAKWMGSANSIAFILGSIFVISKWQTIIGLVLSFGRYLREVALALSLVGAGEETVTALGLLMDAVLAPIALIPIAIVAAVAAIATLITQWKKFQDGFTTGWVDRFFLYISDAMARFGAMLDWLGAKAQIGILKMLSYVPGGLTDEQQKHLGTLQKEYGMTEGEYEDNAARKNRESHRADQSRAQLLQNARDAKPDLDRGQLLAYIQKSSPDEYQRLIAPMLLKPDSPPKFGAPGSQQVTNRVQQSRTESNSFTINSMVVNANDPKEFSNALAKEANKSGDALGSAMLNFGLPAGMRP